MPRVYEQVEDETPYTFYSGLNLSFQHKAAVYGRQSTKDQPIKNRESYEQQTVELVDIAKELGFNELDDIVVFIENKDKDGKWVKASGRLRIDQRPGLSALVELIERDVIKTVFAWAVDRLFRDEDMIQPSVFVKNCKDHHVIIITIDDFFDFNNPKREDRRRFLDLCQAAADYLTKHVKKMNDGKARVARRGEYDGRAYPAGLYIPKGSKKPAIYEPWAPIVRWIIKRCRQLEGSVYRLHKEIVKKGYLFPYPSEGITFPAVRLTKLEKGYSITVKGLQQYITNIALIGDWYFKEKGKSTIVIKNNHPAIIDGLGVDIEGDVVTLDDFWYCYKKNSTTMPDGTPIDQTNRSKKGKVHNPTRTQLGLLEDVITSTEDHPVYVMGNADKENAAAYTIMNTNQQIIAGAEVAYTNYIGSIRVKELDPIFAKQVKFRLPYFQAVDTLLDAVQPSQERKRSIYKHLLAVQNEITKSNISVNDQIAEIKPEIANIDRTLRLASNDLDEDTIRKYAKRLARLKRILIDLENKESQAKASEEDLREIATNLADTSENWDALSFERKRKLIKIIIDRVVLVQIAEGWMQLDIEWSPYTGFQFIDRAYIFQQRGVAKQWTEEEHQILREMYHSADRKSILQRLSHRSWVSMFCETSRLGIKRSGHYSNNTDLPIWMSYDDKKIIDQYNIDLGSNIRRLKPSKNVDWKMFAKLEDETSS